MTKKEWAAVRERLYSMLLKNPPNTDIITVGMNSGETMKGTWAPFVEGKTRTHVSTSLIEMTLDDREVVVICCREVAWIAYERAPLIKQQPNGDVVREATRNWPTEPPAAEIGSLVK